MVRFILGAVIVFLFGSRADTQVPGNCGLQLGGPVIFCDTFDTKNPGIPSRTGDLDPNVWGVSRLSGGGTSWAPTALVACNGTSTVSSPRDIVICNGQLRQASNDHTDVTVLAMYPKQPFDFAGRTGTVSFDVSNDTQGMHAAWPEFWITDAPVPAPFSHFDSWIGFPKNGFGIRFAANGEIGSYGICPNGNNLDKRRFTVDSAVISRNYNYEDVVFNGTAYAYPSATGTKLNVLDCVIMSPGPNGPLNHVEVKVSQNLLEVWASDAGSTALKKIATITNPNLSFTRGLVWLQDVHYNAIKGACGGPEGTFPANGACQSQHTFTWDNLAFDGPFTYRDFSYDALDDNSPNGDGTFNLGKTVPPNQITTWNVLNMPANPQAAAVRVLFNWRTYFGNKPNNIFVKVNGNSHTIPYPYPPNDNPFGSAGWRTYSLTIPITDLVAGNNAVTIGTDVQNDNTLVQNVNIVLVDVPGGVPILPGSNNTYPAGGGSPTTTPINGFCGSANGTTVSMAPTTNLCAAGTASPVSGAGPWSWSCAGSNGGTTAMCSANKTPASPQANCGLSAPAFCDNFNQGPSAIRGRGGDLDPAKWATSRLSGEILSSGQGTASPVPIAPIPQCRAGITQSSVFPPNDTLICDPSGTKSSQLMTAVSMQNYGVNSYMPRQPFDFAGRTGKIVFDVDAVSTYTGGFIEIELTEDPSPATTFREYQNYEVGPVPRNGLSIKFLNDCSSAGAAPVNTMVYNNYTGVIVAPTFNHADGCAVTSLGSLNHFEIQVSQTHVDVYGSDFSTDNGQTFPNYRLLYSANINLPFTRGYVHFNARNHATVKYGYGPDAVFHWDNLGFDGPVLPAPRAYEIPDNTTTVAYNGSQEQNLGWWLLDSAKGSAGPGIYNPTSKLNALVFQGVDISGIVSATLTMNAHFSIYFDTPNATWGISYRFNGGAWRNHTLTPGDLAGINAIPGAPLGMLAWALDVPTTDIIAGNNSLEIVPLNAPMSYPPVVANIDLLVGTIGGPPTTPPPTVTLSASPASVTLTWSSTNATSCVASGGWSGTRPTSGSVLIAPPSTIPYTLTCMGTGGTSSITVN